MRYFLLIFVFVFLFGGIVTAEDYNDFYGSEETIKNKCIGDWLDDFSMQKSCIDRHTKSVSELEQGNVYGVPDDTFNIIRSKCGRDWPDDYSMRASCEKRQADAWLKIYR